MTNPSFSTQNGQGSDTSGGSPSHHERVGMHPPL